MTDAVSSVVGPPLPLIGINDTVSAAREAFAGADALLVTEGGKPVAVLTRPDLLTFLSE
jgi:cystathionine beta-synthase